tara:strand:- start:4700 stop:6157 length:1458 start_codon:yes stop_codon:yes gene_type:complete
MDITKEKKKVFGDIAALRVSAEGFPKLSNITNSIESIIQEANSLDFLTDLLKALVGFEAIKETVVETLAYNLDDIEDEVKLALKKVFKSLVSCSINPSIPDWFIDDGLRIEIDKIDYLNILKIQPTSEAGKLIYNDVFSGSESTDFNTFLYQTIQAPGETGSWGHVTTNEDILNIEFNDIVTDPLIPNNTLLIKPSLVYSDGTKKLTDLNNAYIDSIKLFESTKLINNIIDLIFGSISGLVNKDKRSLQNEIEIEEIINRIINADEEIIIDDSYFAFTNDEYLEIENKAELRRRGFKILHTCGDSKSEINVSLLTDLESEMEALSEETPTAELVEIKTTIIRNKIDELATASVENVLDEDKQTGKINFIEEFLKKIMTSIVNVILSPKLILLFAINHKIIYGETFENLEDFMKKNKWLLTLVLESVRDEIVNVLMEKVLKEIKKLVADNLIKTQIERIKATKAQLASLTGVPKSVLRSIAGLTKT